MSYINFESAREKESQRERKREARARILEEAKEQYERKQAKEELAKQRGEDKWISPAVEARIQAEEKKHKLKKKKKKHKKHKKKAQSSASSESCSEEELQWVEKTAAVTSQDSVAGSSQLQRDDWMVMPALIPCVTKKEIKEREKPEKKEDGNEEEARKLMMDKPGQHARELNPYWKDGGTGLPQECPEEKTSAGFKVEDGGSSWLQRAYRRAVEQAKEEGRTLEEVAAERWGSLDKLQQLLAASERCSVGKEVNKRRYEREKEEKTQFSRSTSDLRSKEKYEDRNRKQRYRDTEKRDDTERSKKRRESRESSSSRERDEDKERKSRDRSKDRERRSRMRSKDRERGGRERSRDRDGRSRKRSSKERKRRSRERSEDREERKRRSRERSEDREERKRKSRERSKERERRSREKSKDVERRSRERSEKRERESRERSEDAGEEIYREKSDSHSSQKQFSGFGGSQDGRGNLVRPVHDEGIEGEKFVGDNLPEKYTTSTRKGLFNYGGHTGGSDTPALSGRFQKPSLDGSSNVEYRQYSCKTSGGGGWRKKTREVEESREELKKEQKMPSSSDDSDSDSSDRKDASEEESTPLLTDKDLNELGAKIVKMEILGNQAMADQLKKKLEAAKKARETRDAEVKQEKEPEEVVVLTRTNAKGFLHPVQRSDQQHLSDSRKRKKQKVETHVEGKRVRYFADDDRHSLREMFEREKLTAAEDQNSMFVKLAGKGLEKTDEDYDLDDVFVKRVSKKESGALEQERDRDRAIQEHKQMTVALEGCRWCFDSKHMLKHLIIAIGIKTYLLVPPYQSLTEGHCIIAPLHHVTCATQLDEDVWTEIKVFQKGLTKMFEDQDKDVVFFETAVSLKKFPHMAVECVPVPRESGNTLPIYFKKALLECETEWSNNKKVIDLSQRNVRRAVPKGLPYFAVDFGLQGGFAHVIEDERLFPKNFAQEIIGGILDLEPQIWRKHKKETFDIQRKKNLKLAEWWKPYDWTQKLKEGD